MRPSVRTLLLASAACVAGFIGLFAFIHTGAGKWLDNAALDGFLSALSPRTRPLADAISKLCDPGPYLVFGIIVAAVAARTHGPRRAAAVVALIAGSAVTTQFLKVLLAQGRFDHDVVQTHYFATQAIPAAAFPSGHATAAMALALAAVIAVPRAWRPLVAVAGVSFATAVSFAIVSLGWHYPSDIVGAYMVAATWTLLLLAALRAAEQRWPDRGSMRDAARRALGTKDALRALAGAVALTCAAVAGIGLARVDRLARFADEHTVATAAAMAISLCAAAVVAGVTIVSSRRS